MKNFVLILLAICGSQIANAQLLITGISPGANSTSVAVDGNIQVTFDAAIDGTTIAGNILLRGEQSGLLAFTTSGTGTAVITIDPTNDFLAGENIYLTITDGVESTLGESLPLGETFRFNPAVSSAYEDPPVLVRNDVSTAGSISAVIAADLDSDGNMDVITSTSFLSWYESDGLGGFNKTSLGAASNILHGIHPSDLDSDGDMDIVAFSVTGDEIMWFENDGSENLTEHSVVTSADGAYHVHTMDMDGDGDVDIVAAVEREGVFWYENDGSENFTEKEINTTDVSWPHAVNAVDIDADGDMDVVSGSWANDKIAWHENDGSGNFTFNEISASANGVWSIYTIDMDGDNDVDVLSASWYDDKIAWYENDGNGNFTTHTISTNADEAYWVYAADVDGDSDIDVLSASKTDDKLAWYENDGNENFTEVLITNELDEVRYVSAVDMNADGRMDVLSYSATDQDVVWFENKANSSPQLDNAISDQSTLAYLPFNFSFAEDAFSDPDGSELITYSATLSDDSPLPGWVTFDPENRKFGGVPEPGDAGTITIKVVAEDPVGASVSDEFDVVITVPSLMTIQSASPGFHEPDVPRNSNITLTFDETIDVLTLISDNIIIRGSLTGIIDGTFSGGGTTTISFDPTNDFLPGENVFITLTTDLESETGSILQGGKSYQFEAASDTPPTWPALLVAEPDISTSANAQKLEVADLDGDGDLDILLPISGTIEFHKNDGNQNFSVTAITTSGVSGNRTIFVDDLDLDGDLDLLAGASNGSANWLENDGSENFTLHNITTGLNSIRSVTSGDMDGDGDIDILSASQQDNTVAWYENDGSQNYTKIVISSGVSWTYGARMIDLDGDLDMDVVAGAQSTDELFWFENDGGQNFTSHLITSSANGVDGIRVADLDGDGDIDILTAERNDDEVMWYENDGDENFTEQTISNTVDGPISVEVADMDGDGDLDVITGTDIDNQVIWHENDGSENFTPYLIFEAEGHDIKAVDLDGDGTMDIVSVADAEDALRWARNKANTTPTLENMIADQDGIADIAFSFTLPGNTFNDVDGNFLLNYSAFLSDDSTLPTWLNFDPDGLQFSGTPAIGDIGTMSIKVTATDPSGASASDEFDLIISQPPLLSITQIVPAQGSNAISKSSNIEITFDENVDVTSVSSSTILVRGDASGTVDAGYGVSGAVVTIDPSASFEEGERVYVTVSTSVKGSATEVVAKPYSFSFVVETGAALASPALFVSQGSVASNINLATSIQAIDLNEDGHMDMLSSSRDAKINWYQNDGNQNFTQQTLFTNVSALEDLLVVNMDGDDDLDLIVAADNSGKIQWYENNGNEVFTEKTIAISVTGARAVYAIDLDGDADLDVISASTFAVNWYENDGSQNFTTHDLSSTANSPKVVYALDFDLDGDIDIMSGGSSTVSWYENDGVQNFTQHDLPFSIGNAEDIISIDVDGDGDIDLAAVERTNDEFRWYENDGTETFTEHLISDAIANGFALTAADLDGDGDVDFASATTNDDRLDWFENDGNQNFTTHTISNSADGVRSLVARDMDNDGDLDLVSGNYEGSEVVWYESRANTSPVLENSLSSQSTNEDEAYSFIIPSNTFSDSDGDQLSYSASLQDDSSLPAWLTFTSLTREFNGTPTMDDIGIITVKVIADDGLGATATDEFELEVLNTNDAPIVNKEIPNKNAVALSNFEFIFESNTFTDEDGDDLTYASELSDGSVLPAWLSFVGSTRTFSGTPTNDDVGSIMIKVIADDGNGGSVSDEFGLTVVFTNQSPQLDNAIADQSASEDAAFEFIFDSNTFSDPDGDNITYSAEQSDGSALPSWLLFSESERTFSGSPAQSDVGVLVVSLIASDPAGASVADEFQIEVLATNDAPVLLVGVPDQTAQEDVAFAFEFDESTFGDEDGDELTYTATLDDGSNLPNWLNFDESQRLFSGKPSSSEGGTITIVLTATDPDLSSVSDQFDLVVELVNDAPTVLNPIADQNAFEGVLFFIEFAENTFVDLDGDELMYSSTLIDGTSLPSWLTFDPIARTFRGRPESSDVGTLTIRLVAEDGNGGSVADEFDLVVIETKEEQSISFASLESRIYGDDPFDLIATATSGLPVSFESSNELVATISGSEITILGAGTTTITASQGGDDDFEAAANQEQIFIVIKADQTISIMLIEDREITDDPFDVVATVDSGLPLSYTVTGPASIEGVTITLDGSAGTVNVMVSQEGDNNYNPTESSTSFEVIEMALGFEDEISIKIYPNPVSNFLIIQSEKSPDVKIYTIGGELIMQKEQATKPISLQHLKAGMYLIEILVDGTSSTSRFYKSN